MGWIYIHTNKINGKKYIGQTTAEPSRRWGSNGCRYKGQPFYCAIKKYGWDNFEHEVRKCPDCLLDVMERNLIEYYHTTDRAFGYNLDSGGNKNKHHSEETRAKLSEVNKGKALSKETKKKISESLKGKYTGEKNSNYGKYHSEDHKNKISKSLKGHSTSEDTKKKMSESQKGKYIGEKSSNYGKHRSDETKKKISESKEKFHYIIQSPSDEIFETNSLSAFCKEHNISNGNLVSRGRSKGYTVLSKETLWH